MNQKTLVVLASIGSLCGIFLLLLVYCNEDYSKNIDDIGIDEIAKVNGEVVSVFTSGNTTFLEVMQPAYIDVVVFSDVKLQAGEEIEVIGKSEEYNGKKEIIAHRIRVIS